MLFGRPRRRSRHDFAERDAEFNLNGRHVLARRVSRAGAQFESRIVLLHLRNACPSRFLKTERSPPSAPALRPSQRPGQPRGGLRRLARPVRAARACSPSPWGDVGYFRISVYGACCQAREGGFCVTNEGTIFLRTNTMDLGKLHAVISLHDPHRVIFQNSMKFT